MSANSVKTVGGLAFNGEGGIRTLAKSPPALEAGMYPFSAISSTRWLEMLEQERRELLAENGVRSRATNVYAIGVPLRYVKIGVADKPKDRLKDLQVGNPEELTLLGYIQGPVGWESIIHNALAGSRLRGEWFAWSEAINGLLEAFQRGSLGVKVTRAQSTEGGPA